MTKKYDALKSEYNETVSKMEKSKRNNHNQSLQGNAIELYRGMSKEHEMRFMLSLIDKKLHIPIRTSRLIGGGNINIVKAVTLLLYTIYHFL